MSFFETFRTENFLKRREVHGVMTKITVSNLPLFAIETIDFSGRRILMSFVVVGVSL